MSRVQPEIKNENKQSESVFTKVDLDEGGDLFFRSDRNRKDSDRANLRVYVENSQLIYYWNGKKKIFEGLEEKQASLVVELFNKSGLEKNGVLKNNQLSPEERSACEELLKITSKSKHTQKEKTSILVKRSHPDAGAVLCDVDETMTGEHLSDMLIDVESLVIDKATNEARKAYRAQKAAKKSTESADDKKDSADDDEALRKKEAEEEEQIVDAAYDKAKQDFTDHGAWEASKTVIRHDLVFVSFKEEQKPTAEQLRQIAKDNKDTFVVYKQGDNYHGLGNPDGRGEHWQTIALDADVCRKHDSFFPQPGEPAVLLKYDANEDADEAPHKNICADIVEKRGHTKFSSLNGEPQKIKSSIQAVQKQGIAFCTVSFTSVGHVQARLLQERIGIDSDILMIDIEPVLDNKNGNPIVTVIQDPNNPKPNLIIMIVGSPKDENKVTKVSPKHHVDQAIFYLKKVLGINDNPKKRAFFEDSKRHSEAYLKKYAECVPVVSEDEFNKFILTSPQEARMTQKSDGSWRIWGFKDNQYQESPLKGDFEKYISNSILFPDSKPIFDELRKCHTPSAKEKEELSALVRLVKKLEDGGTGEHWDYMVDISPRLAPPQVAVAAVIQPKESRNDPTAPAPSGGDSASSGIGENRSGQSQDPSNQPSAQQGVIMTPPPQAPSTVHVSPMPSSDNSRMGGSRPSYQQSAQPRLMAAAQDRPAQGADPSTPLLDSNQRSSDDATNTGNKSSLCPGACVAL